MPAQQRNTRILLIVLMLLATHIFNAGLYGFAYVGAAEIFEVGALGGAPTVRALDYFYFSMVTYTSLGLGDVYPQDHLRFIAGVEAVNGLLFIAWSADYFQGDERTAFLTINGSRGIFFLDLPLAGSRMLAIRAVPESDRGM